MNRTFGRRRGLAASLEEDAVRFGGVEGDDEVPAADVAGIDANIAAAEVVELAQEAEEHEVEMDNAVEAVDRVETAVEIAEDSQAEGGLSPAAAAMMQEAVDGAAEQAGLDPEEAVALPAAESFGSVSSRSAQTALCIEGAKEVVKKMIDAIIKGLIRAKEWIRANYNKFFGAAEVLNKRAQAAKKRAEGLKGATRKEGHEFKLDDIAPSVAVGTGFKVSDAEAYSAAFYNFMQKIDAIKTGASKVVSEAKKLDAAAVKPFYSAVESAFKDGPEIKAEDGFKVVSSPALPGNKVLAAQVPSVDAADANKVSEQLNAFWMKAVEDPAAPKEGIKIEPLSPEDAANVIFSVISCSGHAIAGKNKIYAMEKLLDEAIAAAKKSASEDINKLEGEAKKAATEAQKQLNKALTAVIKVAQSGPSTILKFSVDTGNALLNYVDKSLAGYAVAK